MTYLGITYSTWLTSRQHTVIAFDPEQQIEKIKLEDSLSKWFNFYKEKPYTLTITSNIPDFSKTDLLWMTYDTPITEEGNADVNFIMERANFILNLIPDSLLVVISSQVPVGTIVKLEKQWPNKKICYIPENVRVGKSWDYLNNLDRLILGTRRQSDFNIIDKITCGCPIITMSPESAEMTKHTINCFLGTCISFINEMTSICKIVGADPTDVSKGIKSEYRIGFKLPLSPGGPFNSGHLERDLLYIEDIAEKSLLKIPLILSITISNNQLKNPSINKVQWYDECPVCGSGMSGISKKTAKCTNTMCDTRDFFEGI